MQLEKARPPTIENLQNPILIWKEHMTTFVMKQASQRERERERERETYLLKKKRLRSADHVSAGDPNLATCCR